MLLRRHQIAQLQSDFYRDKYRKILRWITYSIIIMLILISVIIFYILSVSPQRYYGNTGDGDIISMPRPQVDY